jgi:hypothetical protein
MMIFAASWQRNWQAEFLAKWALKTAKLIKPAYRLFRKGL